MTDLTQLLGDLASLVWVAIADNLSILLIYGIPIAVFAGVFLRRKSTATQESLSTYLKVQEKGLTEPASLHPVIDPNICIGCGACVNACPEGNVLGLIEERALLINPTHCIGHGACKGSCPMDAITLVFGTAKRGVDIPVLKPNFETNVPGIFIAGELGGMGLIRNAVEQGRQAMDAVKQKIRGEASGAPVDVVIIGAGPAGLSASLAALAGGLKYVTLEQDTLGGAVAHFPRGKLVMTQPAELPIIGKVKISETNKEALLQFWEAIVKKTGLKINTQERMDDITPAQGGGMVVKTAKGSYHTKAVLLCIGRRGTPRKLGVPGENRAKVVYSLVDSAQYRGQKVLVVGGGNSALEAAASLADEPGTTVALSYRSGAFTRANEANRERVAEREAAGTLRVLMNSNVKEIGDKEVTIEQQGELITLPNDAVIVSAGGILPTPFLKKIGIQVETKHGAP